MTKGPCKYAAVLLLFCTALAGAQETSWRVFSVGGDVTLTRAGSRSRVLPGSILDVGDMLQSSLGYAEFQIEDGLPGGGGAYTVIKIYENTTLIIESSALNLVYGRLRANLGSSGELSIKAGNSAIVFDGDIAADYAMRQGDDTPLLHIHCFRGGGNLIPLARQEGAVPALPLKEGEALSLEYHLPFSWVERRAIGAETVPYWTDAFSSAPLAVSETDFGGIPSSVETTRSKINLGDVSPGSPRNKKIAYTVVGLLFTAAGGSLFALSRRGDISGHRDYFKYGSFYSFALGASFFAGAIGAR
jgi:hypothetical protein